MAIRRVRSAGAEYQLALALRDNRKQRQRQRRFLVESVRGIKQAVAHGWEIDSFWYPAGRRLSGWARSLLDSGLAGRHYELEPALMAGLSEKEETSELIAVAAIPPDELGRIRLRAGLVVAFDRPVSPGNLGAVIRSADAFGADGVVVTGHAADVYDPRTVRATMGSLFSLPVVRAASPEVVVGAFAGLRVVGSSARAPTPLHEARLDGPLLLAVGNETRGLSAPWRELCAELVLIPMRGAADSLNAAAAASILLYEIDRRRRA